MTPFDVFNADPFKATSLSTAIDKMDYVPGLLGSIPNLFVPDPVRTEDIWIEERSTGAIILPTSPRGAPPHQTGGDQRKARAFKTRRIADASRITASELLSIRSFGSELSLKSVQEEVARRQFKIKQNFDLTWENLRMGAILGKVLDSNGTTVIYDWEAEFGQTIPAEVDFDLDNASPAEGALRKKCNAAKRSILAGLKGVGTPSDIIAICGDAFWDDLTSHPEVIKTYLNQDARNGEWLRNGHGVPWDSFRYGGITFVNYRGTDDGTTLAVHTDKAKFFPTGAGIFRWVMSPGEAFEHIGSLGQNVYSNMVMDKDRNAWADVEVYSYILPVCTMPQALYRAKRT
jgi:hypothetical protein